MISILSQERSSDQNDRQTEKGGLYEIQEDVFIENVDYNKSKSPIIID